ncbi:MAG: hypothetical protein LBJ84_02860 [Oscillospiraceae bacterium]|nr:hypothetical protein [Oscillospiraceae bacterium]
MDEWLNDGLRAQGYCGMKCIEGGEIIGIVSARPGVEFTCGHQELVREIERRWKGAVLYTADMGLVLPPHRRRGIARTLLCLVRDKLISMRCSHLVTEHWLRGAQDCGVEHSPQMLPVVRECLGELHIVGEFPDFYRELGKYGMVCPYCGGSRCVCGAMVGVSDITAPLREERSRAI